MTMDTTRKQIVHDKGSRPTETSRRRPVPTPRKPRPPRPIPTENTCTSSIINGSEHHVSPPSNVPLKNKESHCHPAKIHPKNRPPTSSSRGDLTINKAGATANIGDDHYNTIPPSEVKTLIPKPKSQAPTGHSEDVPILPPRQYNRSEGNNVNLYTDGPVRLQAAGGRYPQQISQPPGKSHSPRGAEKVSQSSAKQPSSPKVHAPFNPSKTRSAEPEVRTKSRLPSPPTSTLPGWRQDEQIPIMGLTRPDFMTTSSLSLTSSVCLEDNPWYHSHIDKDVSATRLIRNAEEGAFLVRKSSPQSTHPYSLDVYFQGKVDRLKILQNQGTRYNYYFLEGSESKRFQNVSGLVDKLMRHGLEIKDQDGEWHEILILPLDHSNYHSNI